MGTIASHRVDAPTHSRTRFNRITRRYFKKMSTFGFPPSEAEPKGPSKASVGRNADKVHAVEIVVEEDKPTLTEPYSQSLTRKGMALPITNDFNTTEGSTLREEEAKKKELTDAQVLEILDKAVKARDARLLKAVKTVKDRNAPSLRRKYCISFLVFFIIGIIGGLTTYFVRKYYSY